MSEVLPADDVGAIRREPNGDAVAVRGINEDNEPTWYVIDTGGGGFSEMPNISSWLLVCLAPHE